MDSDKKTNHLSHKKNTVEESQPVYGFVSKSPEEKLSDLVFRSDMEKLQAFTRMLRRNATLKRGVVTHHSNK